MEMLHLADILIDEYIIDFILFYLQFPEMYKAIYDCETIITVLPSSTNFPVEKNSD